MTENEIAKIVVDSAYHIHRRLGPGLLESVYELILAYALSSRGLNVERQVPVPIVLMAFFECQQSVGFLCVFAALRETFSVPACSG